MIQQLLTMLELQEEMNQKVHPEWRTQGFQWHRAIWVECAELMEHHGWKWWKKHNPDRNQVVLEIIDIWHFGLSAMLENTPNPEILAEQVQHSLSQPRPPQNFLDAVEQLAGHALSHKRFDIATFVSLMQHVDLGFDELFRRYVGKNVLNLFRQDNGYKDGTYRKVWAGKEDNEHLIEILESLDTQANAVRSRLFQALDQRYRDLQD